MLVHNNCAANGGAVAPSSIALPGELVPPTVDTGAISTVTVPYSSPPWRIVGDWLADTYIYSYGNYYWNYGFGRGYGYWPALQSYYTTVWSPGSYGWYGWNGGLHGSEAIRPQDSLPVVFCASLFESPFELRALGPHLAKSGQDDHGRARPDRAQLVNDLRHGGRGNRDDSQVRRLGQVRDALAGWQPLHLLIFRIDRVDRPPRIRRRGGCGRA